MYYLRSTSLQRADKVAHKVVFQEIEFKKRDGNNIRNISGFSSEETAANNNYEECLACQ